MEQSNGTRSKLHSALDKFLTSDKTRPEDEHALLKYLSETPYSVPPVDLVPIQEIEERLDFAQHVRGFVQNFFLDLDGPTKTRLLRAAARPRSDSTPSWVTQFTLDTESTIDEDEFEEEPVCEEDGSVRRDSEDQEACLGRDKNVCLVTGAGYPEAYHIFLFYFDSTEQNVDVTRLLIQNACKLLGLDECLLGEDLGSSLEGWTKTGTCYP